MRTEQTPIGNFPEIPHLVTISDACRILDVSRTFAYGLIRQKKLRTIKLGSRAVRITRAEIVPLLTEGTEGQS